MQRENILKTLDIAETRNRFPTLLPWYPIDVRLSAYRDNSDWALVIETFIFNQTLVGHDCPTTLVYCFGSEIDLTSEKSIQDLRVTSDGSCGQLFDNSEFRNLIRDGATDCRVRGNTFPVTTDLTSYTAANIDLAESPRIRGYELFRLLTPSLRRQFFMTENEIIKNIGVSMPLILRLNEWHHLGTERSEVPSDLESFQMIADVIVHDEPSMYKPSQTPNTHWRNWPMAGTI